MPRANLADLKPQYLEFIDLIRECRIAELGKRGFIHVPKDAINSIASEHKIMRYIRQLHDEGILGDIEGATDSRVPFAAVEEDGETNFIFNCQKTAEEIMSYKRSLIGIPGGPQEVLFPVNSWESVTIRFLTEREVFIRTPEDRKHMDHEAMGFIDSRRRLPDAAWMFLYELARCDGVILKEHLSDNEWQRIKKQKQLLMRGLQAVFGLQEDPFFDSREIGGYKIKINLEAPIEAEPEEDDIYR